MIGRGFGASELAIELHLSVKTIETYQAHIKQKARIAERGPAQRKSYALGGAVNAAKCANKEADKNRSPISMNIELLAHAKADVPNGFATEALL
jgi:hypothetical protein